VKHRCVFSLGGCIRNSMALCQTGRLYRKRVKCRTA
jgi:hypothetical protein